MVAKLITLKKRPGTVRRAARGLIKVASLGVVGLLAGLLSGCSATQTAPSVNSYAQAVGNWQFTSSAKTSLLPALAGNLTISGSQVSGMLHPQASPYDCVSYKTSFPVSGPIDSDGSLTLTSTGFSGGHLTLTGKLSTAQNTLTNAAYSVSNGVCALNTTSSSGSLYTPVSGTYSGTIYSDAGTSLYVSTVFTQTTQPDANGTYHLQGNSTFGSMQPCLPVPPSISDSAVTGSSLSATYTESPNGTLVTVVVDATFTPDASSLTLNSYHITGGYCDGDSGHGTLTRQ
jgi:hypothetical protein